MSQCYYHFRTIQRRRLVYRTIRHDTKASRAGCSHQFVGFCDGQGCCVCQPGHLRLKLLSDESIFILEKRDFFLLRK